MFNEDAEAAATTADQVDKGPETTTKEKRRWFHSLTRRKKAQSQSSASVAVTTHAAQLQNNNNNDASHVGVGAMLADNVAGSSRKRKDEKNVFQRFRKKLGFQSLRRHDCDDAAEAGGASGTTDASSEFLTHSPQMREPQLKFSFEANNSPSSEAAVMVPFTHNYERFIAMKWLERESGPNYVMFKASSEMLSQVWYWGEISRRDAQKQLTDKPTGSFLVRDSETSRSQFTLSFRMVNMTLHYRLEYRENYWKFEELRYESIVQMIDDILHRCTNDSFVVFVTLPNEMQPPFPVVLKYPLSRYLKLPNLQDLCRRVIQQHSTPKEIDRLPIPPTLQEFLAVKRELVFQS